MSAKRPTEKSVPVSDHPEETVESTEMSPKTGLIVRAKTWLKAWRQGFSEKKALLNVDGDKKSEVPGKKEKKTRSDPVNTTHSEKSDSASQTVLEEDPEQAARRECQQLLRCQPAADRGLYRTAMQRGWKRILEIGIHDGTRGQNLLTCAATQNPKESLFYVGIDLFEASGDVGSVSLKDAQKKFTSLAGKTRLLPGEPLSVLKANAKSIGTFDAIVLSTGLNRKMIDQCWELFMQLCHDGSVLLVEPSPSDRRPRWRCLTSEDVLEIADWKAQSRV